jgi:hypothetical protein
MAVTSAASGTLAANVGATPDVLAALETAGVYVLEVDTVNMVAGDVIVLRVQKMTLTGGTVRTYILQTYFGAQPTDDLIKRSIPISADLTDTDSLKFTLNQSFGVSRNFPWKVQLHA